MAYPENEIAYNITRVILNIVHKTKESIGFWIDAAKEYMNNYDKYATDIEKYLLLA